MTFSQIPQDFRVVHTLKLFPSKNQAFSANNYEPTKNNMDTNGDHYRYNRQAESGLWRP